MGHTASITLSALILATGVGLPTARADEPSTTEATPAPAPDVPDHPDKDSELRPTETEALMKFFLFDREKGEPIAGIVVALTAPDGAAFYTRETDPDGCADLLAPVGQTYELHYLSLGRREIRAKLEVPDKKNLTFRHTLRYRSRRARAESPRTAVEPSYVLQGVTFDTGKATLRPASASRLDDVLEFLTHKPGTRVQISGHTDNVGDSTSNQTLSEARAAACRSYLVDRGIDAGRIDAVGYGDSQPTATNDTPEGRQENRRIEVRELR